MRASTSLKLLYVGGLEHGRGLDIAIRALPLIKQQVPKVQLIIVGAGSSLDHLRHLVESLQLQDNVIFSGWIDSRYIPSLIAAADIGIIPHYVTPHTSTTIPNKLFDYMAQSKPVVATNCPSMMEIVSGADCGRIYRDRDPSHLAQVILGLTDPHVRSQLGTAGRRAVQNKYNWECDTKVVIEAVHHFLVRQPA